MQSTQEYVAFDTDRLKHVHDKEAGTYTVFSPAGDFLYQCPASEVVDLSDADLAAAYLRIARTIVTSARLVTDTGTARVILLNPRSGSATALVGEKVYVLEISGPLVVPAAGVVFDQAYFTGRKVSLVSREGAHVIERVNFARESLISCVEGIMAV